MTRWMKMAAGTTIAIIAVLVFYLGRWEWRDHKFYALHEKLDLGDGREKVLKAVNDSGLDVVDVTSSSLKVVAKVGLDSALYMDLEFDEKGKLVDKAAFDTAVIAKWLF